MDNSKRTFLKSSTLAASTLLLPTIVSKNIAGNALKLIENNERFDPWIEVLPEAIKYNVKALYRLIGNKPIMAVVKNNGYGLGDINVAKIMDDMPEVVGFAAVKVDVCIELRKSGIKKPILHMGMATDKDFEAIVLHDIQVSIYNEGTYKLLDEISKKHKKPVSVHLYIDTGMSRMGIPYYKAMSRIRNISKIKNITILGAFMGFTEEPEFDKLQLDRFKKLHDQVLKKNIDIGRLHAASSNAIFHFPESSLDMVRPGISCMEFIPHILKKKRKFVN